MREKNEKPQINADERRFVERESAVYHLLLLVLEKVRSGLKNNFGVAICLPTARPLAKGIIALLLALIMAQAAQAGDWPMFRHDVTNSGVADEIIEPPLELIWQYKVGSVAGTPSIYKDVVYVSSWDRNTIEGFVYALDASTGSLKWKYKTGNNFTHSTPSASGNLVYGGSGDNYVYALDANTGSLIWKYQTVGRVQTSPTVSGSMVYFGSEDSNLYALDAQTGTLKWKYTTGSIIYSSPAIFGDTLYFGSQDRYIYAINANTGNLKWKYETGGAITFSSPVVSGNNVYIGSYDNYIYALDSGTGGLKWKYQTSGSIDSSPAVYNNVLYVGSKDKYVYAIDTQTGTLKWKYATNGISGWYSFSPVISGNVVYAGPEDGYFYALDADTGSIKWKYKTNAWGYFSTALSKNMVYTGLVDGYVYAFAPAPTPTSTPTTAYIAVDSVPEGASVFLDGIYKGTTPKLLTNVSPGYHNLKFTLSDYSDWSYKTLAAAGGTSYIKAELTTATGGTATATVNVDPIITLTTNKSIYIKGEQINFTITNKGTQNIDAHLLAQNIETGYTILIWPNIPPGCRNPGPNGPFCAPPAPLVLSPGESRYISWQQDDWDLNGQQIPSGIYIGKINWSYQNSNMQYINSYQNFTIAEPATPLPTPTFTETPEILNPELLFKENWLPIGIAIGVMLFIIYSLINALGKNKSKANVIANEEPEPVAAPSEEPDSKSQAVLIEKPKEPLVEKPKESGTISVKSAYEYKGAKIYYKIKIENNAIEPVGDIKVHLFVPDVFLLAEKEKAISMLETKESQTVTFEIRPTGECGECNVSGKIEYYDYAAKGRKMLDIENKSLSVICPVLKRKEISMQQWEKVTDELIKAEEKIKELSAPAENLFNITSRVIKDNGMFMFKPEITSTPSLFNGLAMFYAEGVTGYRYAAYMEVVGGARKSRMILKVWAEKEEALIGFYHRILDDIEKRIDVKIFIDDAIVQQHIHIGDKIGTQVKDSFVQRSNIGVGEMKCPECGKEVEANEKICNECGTRL